jgi:hypothetical protein
MLPLSINPPASPEGLPLPAITAVPRTVELSDGVVNSVHADRMRICASKRGSFMTVVSPESRLAHCTDPGRRRSGRRSRAVARTVELSDSMVNGVHPARSA